MSARTLYRKRNLLPQPDHCTDCPVAKDDPGSLVLELMQSLLYGAALRFDEWA